MVKATASPVEEVPIREVLSQQVEVSVSHACVGADPAISETNYRRVSLGPRSPFSALLRAIYFFALTPARSLV